MIAKRLKRPRDLVQPGKLIGDILTGQVQDRAESPPLDTVKRPGSRRVGPQWRS
jgi:hypothetical protein